MDEILGEKYEISGLNKLQKLEDAIWDTGETWETGKIGGTWETGETGKSKEEMGEKGRR